MAQYRVTYIGFNADIFLDDEIEADGYNDAQEEVFMQIMDDLGNYLEIELEEINEEEEEEN